MAHSGNVIIRKILMIKNTLKIVCIAYISIFFLTACGDIPLRQWLPHRAQVLDVETGKPLEGVIVLARWKGEKSMLVDTQSTCYHVETATTNKNGWFEIPSYNEGLGKASIYNKSLSLTYYRKGYVWGATDGYFYPTAKNIEMKQFKGSRKERFNYLKRLSAHCHEAGDSVKNLYLFRKSIYEELKNIAKTKEEKKYAEHILYFTEEYILKINNAEERYYKRLDEIR